LSKCNQRITIDKLLDRESKAGSYVERIKSEDNRRQAVREREREEGR
jgi:hypothetical protein